MKKCSKCQQPGSFYKDKNAAGGYRSICNACDKAKAKIWNKKNHVKHAEHEKKHRSDNPDRVKANKNKYVKSNPRAIKDSWLKYTYGLGIEEYELMKSNQGDRCAICCKHEDDLYKDLCVDHCHVSGKVRKLLCAKCNSALGFLDENIQNAKNLLKYLEDHNG